jgi:hypothetical protein
VLADVAIDQRRGLRSYDGNGSETVKVEPRFGTLVTSTLPPCNSTNLRVSSRPPSRALLSAISDAMEGFKEVRLVLRRDADTRIADGDLQGAVGATCTHSDPSASVNLIAFESRLRRIWRNLRSSPA